MRAFEATTEIHAPAERVWEILGDGPRYPEWDSGVTRVDGRVARPSPTEMTWTGGMPLGLFTGVRTFRVVPDGDVTRVSMREEYSGLLTGLMARSIPDLGPSFQRFVDGLKAHAETG